MSNFVTLVSMDPRMRKLLFKTILFICSLSIAWWIIKSGVLTNLLENVSSIKFAAEFIAGAFYTSFLTIPIALAMFLVLAPNQNPLLFALIAGVGATLMDLLLVRIFRDNFSSDLSFLTRHWKLYLIKKTLKLLKLDFIIPLFGALIIASPLPDELGLLLLGVSGMKYHQLLILIYILNVLGIILIVTPINLLT